jgi:FkbM family methyltransferase
MTVSSPQADHAYPLRAEAPTTPTARRELLLRDVDVVVDAGANEGQYALWFRSLGFAGRIISVEPQSAPFTTLSAAAARDPRWECHKVALGTCDGQATLRVARNTTVTSLFALTPQLQRVVPDATEIGAEAVPMRSLASLWPSLHDAGERVYLKIDVEGAELDVLRGAGDVLEYVDILELELSLAPNFSGAPLIDEVLAYVLGRGYYIVALEANHGDDPDIGQMLVVDGLFRRPR